MSVNLKSLEYFVEVAKDLNMTTAAQRLYISQQALSSQILKLENYYGVTLFERQPKLQLTYAGQVLLEGATSLLQESKEITNSLADISNKHIGILRIGIPAYRAASCFPLVLSEYTRHWPNVSVHLEEAPSTEMLRMMYEGALDACVVTPSASELAMYKDKIKFTRLLREKTYLVASRELLERHFKDRAEELIAGAADGTDLKGFEELPFMLHKPPMRLRLIADECFNSAGFKPKVFIETSNTELMISLYPCHLGAFFCRRSRVPSLINSLENCVIFPLKYEIEPLPSTVYFARLKKNRTPSHILEFEKLMIQAWDKISDI